MIHNNNTAVTRMIAFPSLPVGFETDIIGVDAGLQRVWEALRLVAASEASVLIQGETGTGKELIARAIHDQSRRHTGPYVKVNCATMPAGLIESEMFGHERGAYTGAFAQTVGRFQPADGGTLFLDEIGDLPLELQPKLLRVLQEREFERLGGTRTIRVNLRVISATNADLMPMLRERSFRADLYYRLNVFPISIPPLRKRREDIPALVWHFVQRFARQMNREVDVIPDSVMDALQRQPWPGNVRELQNFVERAVILSPGKIFRPPLDELAAIPETAARSGALTLDEVERDHILDTVRASNGVISGKNGAAIRLGVKRTTLLSRMRKLGITRTSVRGTTLASDSANCDQPVRLDQRKPLP